jgi:L-fucose mutarotase/ribose pyranase (RbsD/FucU family)
MNAAHPSDAATGWESELISRLPLFGHRNWIVIADSAYPAQSNPGIETIVASADQIEVVRKVLAAVASCRHIRANVYIDLELDAVDETDAPGITAYRSQLTALLHGASVKPLMHEQVISKLDECARLFRILIIKTDLTIPYTSVFFELECGYWNAESEERLRSAMSTSN